MIDFASYGTLALAGVGLYNAIAATWAAASAKRSVVELGKLKEGVDGKLTLLIEAREKIAGDAGEKRGVELARAGT